MRCNEEVLTRSQVSGLELGLQVVPGLLSGSLNFGIAEFHLDHAQDRRSNDFLCRHGDFQGARVEFSAGDQVLEGRVEGWIAIVLDDVRLALRVLVSARQQIQLDVWIGDVRWILQRDVLDLVDDDDQTLALD
jgi:hypothetical protein